MISCSCQRPATLDTKITINTDIAFEEWIHRIRYDFTVETIKEIKDARQEIRYVVMTEETGLPFSESQKRVYERIEGQTIRELILKGYELKTPRELDLIKRGRVYIRRIHRRLAWETDVSHRHKLEDQIATIKKRIKAQQEKLNRYEQRQSELQEEKP